MSTVFIPSYDVTAGAGSTISTSGAGSNITVTGGASGSTIAYNNAMWTNTIANGLHIEEGSDLTIGDRSLLTFMDQVEERLAILRPNEGLESRWEQLKELRRQYQELEKDLLEKEKIMDILKDKNER